MEEETLAVFLLNKGEVCLIYFKKYETLQILNDDDAMYVFGQS